MRIREVCMEPSVEKNSSKPTWMNNVGEVIDILLGLILLICMVGLVICIGGWAFEFGGVYAAGVAVVIAIVCLVAN